MNRRGSSDGAAGAGVGLVPNGSPPPADPARLTDLLHDRLRFEALLSRLSATFIHLSAEEVDGQIEQGLGQIVEFLGLDRSSLTQFSEDEAQLLVTHSHSIPGVPPFPPVDLAEIFPWYTAELRRGEILRFARLPDDLPPEAVHERAYCVGAGFRSHLMVPFRVGDRVLGGLAFGSFRRPRGWPDDLVQSLQLVGEVFANALARKRADLALRAAEAELRESEGRFRRLLESTHAVPWVADGRSGRLTYVGPRVADLLGYPPEDWYADDFWTAHIHPDDRAAAVAFRRDHAGRTADYDFEFRMLAADGRTVWVHTLVNVTAEAGEPRTLSGFLIDVTARRRAEEEARRARDRLARAGRASLMGELAATIAHEVNQPLCAVVANAQAAGRLLAAPAPDVAEVREALLDISRDAQRASGVVARVRDTLRQAPAEWSPVEVNDLVREVSALMKGDLGRRGVAVRLDLGPVPPVAGDRGQLQQVVLNLIANGADAMDGVPPGRGQLVLRSAAELGAVTVAVTDAGPGIDADPPGQVFDAFYTTKPGSMGMGLAICKSIVEAHGGRIGVPATGPAGTTIQFSLPATQGAVP